MEPRQRLIQTLSEYQPWDAQEAAMVAQVVEFVSREPHCYERSCLEGHLTASAWIVTQDRKQVVLLHHAKLQRWLQPGGHADGDVDLMRVAKREVEEETGLTGLEAEPGIFDVDVHLIPARKADPDHFHFDIRYLFVLPEALPLVRNEESSQLQWMALASLHQLVSDRSILRMVEKSIHVRM